jgi:DNA polymerase
MRMALDERRLAMLRDMGVPFWRPLQPRSPAPPANAGATGHAPADTPGPPGSDQAASARETIASAKPLAGAARVASPQPLPERRLEPAAPREVSRMAQPAAVPPPPALEAAAPRQGEAHPAVGAAPAVIATLDWPALRATVAACRACGLCESRRQTVFGAGHPRAHWMIVGEAPGEQEDLRGEPFVGPAGQLLDNMLRALGLTRAEAAPEDQPPLEPAQQAYIANTLKCRPPRNRNPEPEEMRRCEPYLQRQIALVQPRLILAMGRFAVQALLRTDEAIGRLRGRVHRYEGVPLIVTYHPAYLLRNLPDKAKAWEDLCLAAQTMEALPPR